MRAYDKKGYYTRTTLVREIKEVIRKAHGELKGVVILINFEMPWREVKYPTGYIAKAARIVVRAEGFPPTTFGVTQERNCKWFMNCLGCKRA